MKFGIVGTGMIAKMMLPEFARCDKFEVHAVCSRKEETGRALAEAFSIPKVYTKLEDMLADENPGLNFCQHQSFPMRRLLASGCQCTGALASAPVLPMNIQD